MKSGYLLWLTACVYFEARGEEKEGMKAVVHTIMNRVSRRKKTIEEIIRERYQFSWYNQVSIQGKKFPAINDWESFLKCGEAIQEALEDRDRGETLKHVDHYFNPNEVLPTWAKGMKFVAQIGNHDFYVS